MGHDHDATAGARADVALVAMPFGPSRQPSIALSLLRQTVDPDRVRVHYETLQFASTVGFDRYIRVTDRYPYEELVGEWIFSEAAFGPDADRDARYLARLERGAGSRRMLDDLEACRDAADRYLDGAVARVLAGDPALVGLTSVFQQHVASIAVAKRIKRARPDTVVAIGGANCEGVMGRATLRVSPDIDVVISGEGEPTFPTVVEHATRGEVPTGLAGVFTRRDLDPLSVQVADPLPAVAMDDLPVPDYADFFEQWRQLDVPRPDPVVLFEAARGCWWGAIRHCTFCGLNGERMAFRSKSPDRAAAELTDLIRTHPGLKVYAVDNIMDRDYYTTFLPAVAASGQRARIFYEVKANLTRPELEALEAAGVTEIQPGIESLSDATLRIMRKGVTAIENVQLLKWCSQLGITVHWNILWGFPGEPDESYTETTALIPQLTHLRPPSSVAQIRLDRYSPNFDRADEFGFVDVRPVPAYQLVYDIDDRLAAELAYFFSFDDSATRSVQPLIDDLMCAVRAWRRSHPGSAMWCVDDGTRLDVWDLRDGPTAVVTELEGLERLMYVECDRCCSAAELVTTARRNGWDVTRAALEELLASLVARRLMMTDGRRYLSLAVAVGDGQIPPQFVTAIAGTGRRAAEPVG